MLEVLRERHQGAHGQEHEQGGECEPGGEQLRHLQLHKRLVHPEADYVGG
jgi:hypothetical protein